MRSSEAHAARRGHAGVIALVFAIAASFAATLAGGQTITRVAGALTADNVPATTARLSYPQGVAVDTAGNVYFADEANHRVRKVAVATGIITTVAGDGVGRHAGDGGNAQAASLRSPSAVALDPAGNLYIADSGNSRLRKVAAGTQVITTLAAVRGSGVAVEASGSLLVADGYALVRRVDPVSGAITNVAGTGTYGFSGDGGPATSAMLSLPTGVAVDGAGNIYIADAGNYRIRKVTPSGIITTFAGTGASSYAGDGGLATAASFSWPNAIAVDAAANVFVTDQTAERVRKITASTGIITTVVGSGAYGSLGDGSPATSAQLAYPNGVAVDASGNLFVSESYGDRVRRVDASSGTITTIAGVGNFGGDGGPAIDAHFDRASGMAVDAAGNLYIADTNNGRIRKVVGGVVNTVAGSGGDGAIGNSGDGGPATSATVQYPVDVTLDSAGNIFIASYWTVRKVTVSTGIITTIAGSGASGYSGDGGPATSASFNFIGGIVVDSAGHVFIADSSNHRVRRVDAATGIVTTVAGTGTGAYSGDGGPASAAQLNGPGALALDSSGNLYIADVNNYRVRKIAAATGTISTVFGAGGCCDATFDPPRPATSVRMLPWGLAVDAAGNLFVTNGQRILRAGASDGIARRVAGNGFSGFAGDGGPAMEASLEARRIVLDSAGNLFVSEPTGQRIRRISRDATAPDTTIVVAPAAATSSRLSTFVFSGSDPGSSSPMFECAIDGAAFAPCGTTTTLSLANGSHTLQVRAVDGWGNTDPTPATHAWSVAAPPAIASSRRHTLALDAAGKVYAWGNDSTGQLGQGRAIHRTSPFQVPGLSQITHIALAGHGLAVDSSRRVWSWGANNCGQLGARDSSVTTRPVRVTGAVNVTMVAAGACFSLALKADGTVLGWGTIPGYGSETGVRTLAGLSGIVEIAAGSVHALARRNDGTVYAFGDNSSGQLGLGTTAGPQAATLVPGLSGITAVSAGLAASAALGASGQVYGWGLIGPNFTAVSSPLQLPATGGANASVHTSRASLTIHVVRSDGTALRYTPTGWISTDFASFPALARAAIGGGFYLGIDATGQLFATGSNRAGQLGLGDTATRTTASAVTGLANVSVVAAETASVLALRSDGTVWFWGQDTVGQSGGGGGFASSVPVAISLPATIAQVAASGLGASFALDSTGAVWGWGNNSATELDSSQVNRALPALVTGHTGIGAIAAGDAFLVALTRAGTVQMSGSFGFFSGGSGSLPATLSGFDGIAAIAAGDGTLYGLTSSGAVYAAGRNDMGQIGDGTTSIRTAGVAVTGITGTVSRISAGGTRAGAITADGKVWMWGGGPLGNGGTANSLTAVQVQGITDAVELSVGSDLVIVRRADGTLLAWGDVGLADATGRDPLLPYPLTTPSSPMASFNAGRNKLGFLVDGNGVAWGFGRYGSMTDTAAAIGDGTYVQRSSPVVLKAPGGSGSVDANDWYLDLDTSSTQTIAASATPKSQSVARLSGSSSGLSMDATVKFKAADNGKRVNIYVFGLVPAEFFGLVKTAPSLSPPAKLAAKAKKNGGFVLAQLTPAGWADVTGQIIAFAQGTANAAGASARILAGINASLIPGARFCLGYGESSGSLLSFQSLSEVLLLEGASANVSGVPCVLTGIYVDGPKTSRAGSAVAFSASVVGLSPTGSIQFKNGAASLSDPLALTASNDAVAKAELRTSALPAGRHSIGAAYGGDAQNASTSSDVPVLLEVVSAAPGASATTLSGPSSSESGSEVVLEASVAGDSPTGSVQFKDGSANLGEAVPLVGGVATLRTEALALGSHVLTAVYSGDSANTAGVSANLAHTVHSGIVTEVTLTSTASSTAVGTAVTFTAHVTGNSPTGNVVFRDGSRVIATVALVNGSASVTVADFDAGQHVITAEYGGDGGNASVTSAGIFQQVGAALSASPGLVDFRTRFLNTPATLDVTLTNQGTAAVTIASVATSAPFSVAHDCQVLQAGQSCKSTVTFTPTATGAASGTLSIGSSAGALSISLIGAGEQSLVSHYYRSILRREPDAAGKAYWEGEAARVSQLGANVNEAWFAMAMSFYGSAEYVAFGRNPTEYVRDLYNTFFNRTADDAGLAYWTGQLAAGMPPEVVLISYMFSTEFANFSRNIFGNVAARAEVDTVVDFYRGLLSRLPDSSGFNFWVGQFRTAQCAGGNAVYAQVEAISSAYASSAEYSARNRTNSQYVGDLYNAFLRRGGDLDGVKYWIGQLDSGAQTRDQLRQAFIASPEFNARVVAIVNQGCLP